MSFDVLFEITNDAGAIDSRNLSWQTEDAICLTYGSTGKAAPVSIHASSISTLHAIALCWWGSVDRACGCNLPQGAINATQRGWLANSIGRSWIGAKGYLCSRRQRIMFAVLIVFYVTSRIMLFLGRRMILLIAHM